MGAEMQEKNTTESIRLIVNPRAGSGRAGAQVDKLRHWASQCFERSEVVLTQAPGHATQLATEAATSGTDIIAAVGGDGTCHEVVNGLFSQEKPVNEACTFTVIPFGTGSDLARSLHMPRRTEEALAVAACGTTRMTDVGVAAFTTESGTHSELFINVAGFGANGEVARRSNMSSKRFGGKATFIGATLRTLASYTPQSVRVTAKTTQGVQIWEDELLSAFVANGHYCGSGMWVGKDGDMSDGQFELSLLCPTSPLQTARDFPRLFNGSLTQGSGVTRLICSELSVEPTQQERVTIELDGESCGHLPATFRILPKILPVRAAW